MKKAIGKIKCLSCGDVMPALQSETGTIDLSCRMCGLSAYAKPGTQAHADALKRMTDKRQTELPLPPPDTTPARPAATTKPPAAKPAPTPAKPATMATLPVTRRNTVFG